MKPRITSGFTLVELLMIMVIISMVATLSMPAYTYLKKHAQNAQCISNLRSIHLGFTSYLSDHEAVWPQKPTNVSGDEAVSNFWYTALQSYGLSISLWTCPTDFDTTDPAQKAKLQQQNAFISSYMVTPYNPLPSTAYQWYQPWVVEKYENHGQGQGPNILMPDGAVRRGVSLLDGG